MLALMLALVSVGLSSPPMAARHPFQVRAPGGVRTDFYYWLRDRENPETIPYLLAENEYAQAFFQARGDLRPVLYEEMADRLPVEYLSAPWEMDGWIYGYRYPAGADYPVYFRRPAGEEDGEFLLFDLNELAEGKGYLHLGGMLPSPDGLLLALCLDTLGDHRASIVFLDTETGAFLPDTLHETSYDMAWATDGKTFFHGFLDETRRTAGFSRYRPGSGEASEPFFFEADSTFWPWMYETRNREWIVIGTESSCTSEYLIFPSNDPEAAPAAVFPRKEGVLYSIEFAGDSLYLLTNEGAENFRLMRTTPFSEESLVCVEPHSSQALLEGITGFRDYLVLRDRIGGRTGLRVRRLPGGEWMRVPLPGEPASLYPSSNHVYDTSFLRFQYSSMLTPWSTVLCDLATGELRYLRTDEVMGYDPGLYAAECLEVITPDGVMVPVSLVYRKDLFRPGGNPLLLEGYGAYGYSFDPMFSSSLLSLLDRGFVYAVAHVRGGQELGRRWYLEGRLLSKINTFTDFIACAEYLAEHAWCDPDRLFAMGDSAGGLLIGAVANMRPDLWRGLVAGVPFVDVVTTMLDPTIPLTTNEYMEWGNPADPVFYHYMLSYSPYDNAAAADYPAMLVTAGFHDSQVGYWEPAKWVAAMRYIGTGDEPLLLMTNMGAGHGGSSGRYSWLWDLADRYAFLLIISEDPGRPDRPGTLDGGGT